MEKRFVVSLLVVAMLSPVSLLLASDDARYEDRGDYGRYGDRDRDSRNGGGYWEERDREHYRWRDQLSDEEWQRMDKLYQSHRDQMRPLRDKMWQEERDIDEMVSAEKPDWQAIEKRLDGVMALRKEMRLAQMRHFAEVREVMGDRHRRRFDDEWRQGEHYHFGDCDMMGPAMERGMHHPHHR